MSVPVFEPCGEDLPQEPISQEAAPEQGETPVTEKRVLTDKELDEMFNNMCCT